MLRASAEYLAAGANRQSSAADWDTSGLLAYGANRNIALWKPQAQGEASQGVSDLLSGHTDTVNALKFLPTRPDLLLSGSADKTLKVWQRNGETHRYACVQTLTDHTSSINCIAVCSRCPRIFATGAADSTVRIWSFADENTVVLTQSLRLTPKFFPLSLALSHLAGSSVSYVLAVAGTTDIIQIYIFDSEEPAPEFKLQATLSGHEGWIRSLEVIYEDSRPQSDLLLSSASQDKYIRLWRIHLGKELPAAPASNPLSHAVLPGVPLSNKVHRLKANGLDFSLTFEALIFGHEDWIYSAKWGRSASRLQLLSASADNSLAIWEPDASTGVFTVTARMGEISSEKGSTTATGSTGGFWTGLWSPSGETVVCLGRTGSWRLWNWDAEKQRWNQGLGISGHMKAVNGIAWSRQGEYLLSTSSDQTTRLHAKWNKGSGFWHEMARPQIHGYDLYCIDSLDHSHFVSAAEEKLLRVFKEPKAVAYLLQKLSGFEVLAPEEMPAAANMPVLGLSNKTIELAAEESENADSHDRPVADATDTRPISSLTLAHPPLEDHLSKYTLWPETEKLYGHGYEISALAVNPDGTLIATACKASSAEHAVIRLYETQDWHEIKPPLVAHSLTVTSLKFSPDHLLLSTGRDRQWFIFRQGAATPHHYTPVASNPKAHSRMIMDAAWAPGNLQIFATAGRDKQTKVWARGEAEAAEHSLAFICRSTLADPHPVTAVSFWGMAMHDGGLRLATGNEVGHVKIYHLDHINWTGRECVVTFDR